MKKLIIVIIAIIVCLVIYQAYKDKIDIWYLIAPISLLLLIGVLSTYLKEEFGKTFGIPGFFIAAFIIVGALFFFSKYFPVTTDTNISKRKHEDLNSFNQYKPGMDARIQIEKLQEENDSLTNLQVSYIRKNADTNNTKNIEAQIEKNISKMDDIYKAIEKNDKLYKKNQKFLFDKNVKESEYQDKNINLSEDLMEVTCDFLPGKIEPSGIILTGKEKVEVIPISGKCEINTNDNQWLLISSHRVFPKGGSPGPLTIKGVTKGKIVIRKIYN